MGLLNKDSILSADDAIKEEVQVPEWGGSVFVRVISGVDRDAWEITMNDGRKKGRKPNIRASLAALSICDNNGARMFSDADVEALGAKSSKALDRIFEVAKRLNGLFDADVREIEKN